MTDKSNQQLPDLDEKILNADPIRQFEEWYDIASSLKLHDAMTLATSTKDGVPSLRVVLLKQVDERGFVFFSNYDSRKGKELSVNPSAALCFHWVQLDRSVRIEGRVSKLPPDESDVYWKTRPREGQLSSLASAQSRVVKGREELDRRYVELEKEYKGREIPRPSHWGGYRLKPGSIEFWQQRFARLNDRILYTLQPNGVWLISRLSP
jgi:pyridoxamine 5'-phosphate oxidase